MSTQLNEIYNDVRNIPGTEHLMFPVSAKKVIFRVNIINSIIFSI